MPTYNVMPHYTPADNDIEADDAQTAIAEAIEGAVELMRDESNSIATEVNGDDRAS